MIFSYKFDALKRKKREEIFKIALNFRTISIKKNFSNVTCRITQQYLKL